MHTLIVMLNFMISSLIFMTAGRREPEMSCNWSLKNQLGLAHGKTLQMIANTCISEDTLWIQDGILLGEMKWNKGCVLFSVTNI